MATSLEQSEIAQKKRARQDSSDPETCCQICNSVITEKIMCQGCKLDYCLKCAGINYRLFEYLTQGDMEDFLWSCKSCKATFPSLDNITKYLKESLDKNDTRMTKIEDRMGKLETSHQSTNKTIIDMKEEICRTIKEDVNRLVDERNSELEDRRRRETNITLFNLSEHNFPSGQENKDADGQDFSQLCTCLGVETPNMITWFRLGRKTPEKTRPLKIVLDNRSKRKTLLENAKYIPQKAPLYLRQVILSKDLTPTQRQERKLRRQRNQNNQPRPQEGPGIRNIPPTRQPNQDDIIGEAISISNSPAAMNTSHGYSPIRVMANMSHLNTSTHSHNTRTLEDAYNNTTIAMEETVIGGLDSQYGLANESIGQIPTVGDEA